MWPFSGFKKKSVSDDTRTPLFLFNTLGRERQEFRLPPVARTVRMYNCGPTLYGRQHIGNLSMFVFTDVLRRVLEYNDYPVKQVINFTDFGHLSSDADEGEDKMAIGLKREGLSPSLENMRSMAEKYAGVFLEDLKALNVASDKILFPYASDHISAQIAMIKTLEEKGYTYKIDDGVYFDTAQFAAYGVLGGVNQKEDETKARVEEKSDKRSPADFALWKTNEEIGWDSPWGKGFPGWHIECSAMIRAILGEQIDIHTGGIEHISIHHNNEIAQSECATGKKPLSRFWLHRAHIQIEGGKIAKSQGNVIYLDEVADKVTPLALRYLFLSAHYRTPMNFTWDALEAAQTAYARLLSFVQKTSEGGAIAPAYKVRILERFNDDIDTAGALAVIWEMLKDESLNDADKRATILNADTVLGLQLEKPAERERALILSLGEEVSEDDLPENIAALVVARHAARETKNWSEADRIRDELAAEGYRVEDKADGAKILRTR